MINLKFSGIIVFLQYWRFNGGLFEAVYFLFNNFNSSNLNLTLESNLRLIFSIIFFILFSLIIGYYYKSKTYNKSIKTTFKYIGLSYIVLFIFSPVVHPWYLLWAMIPFILTDKMYYPYWIFLVLINISYYYYLDPSLSLPLIVIEYTIFYLFMLLFSIKNYSHNKFFNLRPEKRV